MAPDALLNNQWHLKDRTVEVAGANVRNAWPSSLGAGIIIGIVDDGLQYTHPDLSPNYLASASWDFIANDSDPYPTGSRGTAVAGIAAARGDNTIGVSGVAPQASLAGLRLTGGAQTDSQEAAAFNFLPQVIHILNNAWNPSDNGVTLKAPGPLAKAARQSAVINGRNGKGRVFVWPAGDGRLNSDDCNFDGYANSRFAIAVGAFDDTGFASPQTERCAALMVMAPAGLGNRALTTTDLLGASGYEGSDYTSRFGTSLTGGGPAATGTVSGAAALMLSRNPNLGWRDVQDILRRTSVRINPADTEWTLGAFPHSHRLGFGLIDVKAAVDMAGSWVNLPAEEVLTPSTRNLNLAIPDTNPTGVSDTITISSAEANFVIEHVEVDFNASHPWRGDITVSLTSPAGVVSQLATIRPNDFNDNFTNWTFGSVRHWGASAPGAWTLRVADPKFRDVGTWTNWTLRIYGYHGGLALPGAFGRTSPANSATGLSTSPTLSWGQSSAATSYEYCIDTTNNGACNATWTSTGAGTSVGLSGLSSNTTYYWHVRAINGTGTTFANGNASTFWSFTTAAVAPGAFSHSSPAHGATGQSTNPTLSWTASSGATSYAYCIDTNNPCNATWTSTGTATSVAVQGLSPGAFYYWHVRATNGSGTTYAEGSASTFWNFGTQPRPKAMLDLNGDGSGDAFLYNSSSGSWQRQLAQSNGSFAASNGNWAAGWTVVPATFNTDALSDLFLFNPTSGAWYKMLGSGGSLATQASGTWWSGWQRYVMDLDGDGISDVFLYDPATGVWFKCISTPTGFNYFQGGWGTQWEIYPVSLNADGMRDMFLFNRTNGAWFWVLGAVGGGFTYPVSGGWYHGWRLYPGDFNADKLSDLLLYDPGTGAWFVAMNNGAGTGFTYSSGRWALGWTPYVGDLDNDQDQDLFLHNPANGTWYELLSNGSGGFTNGGGSAWALGWNVYPTDFNADGRMDFLLYSSSTGVWYQARNLAIGTFGYSSGSWSPNWVVIVRNSSQ